jgi:hypothetical protein
LSRIAGRLCLVTHAPCPGGTSATKTRTPARHACPGADGAGATCAGPCIDQVGVALGPNERFFDVKSARRGGKGRCREEGEKGTARGNSRESPGAGLPICRRPGLPNAFNAALTKLGPMRDGRRSGDVWRASRHAGTGMMRLSVCTCWKSISGTRSRHKEKTCRRITLERKHENAVQSEAWPFLAPRCPPRHVFRMGSRDAFPGSPGGRGCIPCFVARRNPAFPPDPHFRRSTPSHHPKLVKVLREYTRPGQTRPGQTRPDQAKPDQTGPNQTRPGIKIVCQRDTGSKQTEGSERDNQNSANKRETEQK